MSQRVSLTIEELAWLRVALANDLVAADELMARIEEGARRYGIDIDPGTVKGQRDLIDRLQRKVALAIEATKP